MAGLDNLSRGELAGILKRLRALETAAPLQNASIGENGLRIYGGGGITIENGGLYVNGSATVIGTLNADGTINMTGLFIASGEMQLNGSTIATGDFTISGPLLVDGNTTFNGELTINGITNITGDTSVTGTLNVKGPLNVTGITKLDGKTDIGGNTTVTGDLSVKGPLDVTGTMDIKGKSTLQNDLDVRNGGSVKVGGMTLDPSRNGGSIQFLNGAYLISNGGVTSLAGSGDAYVTLSADLAQIRGAKVALNGQLSNPNYASASSDTKPNVYMDSYGNIKRINPG